MTDIYILRLNHGFYYVGRTLNINQRIKSHFKGEGAYFTKKYRPMEVDKIIRNVSTFDEDKYVKMYMLKYGMDKVRGGSYVLDNLTRTEQKFIQKELWSAQGFCFKCGGKHFINKCKSL